MYNSLGKTRRVHLANVLSQRRVPSTHEAAKTRPGDLSPSGCRLTFTMDRATKQKSAEISNGKLKEKDICMSG